MSLTTLFALLCIAFLFPFACLLTWLSGVVTRVARNWVWRNRIAIEQRRMTIVRGRRVALPCLKSF